MQSLRTDYGMEEFFKQVKQVEELMIKLSNNLKKLQEANEEIKAVTKATTMKGNIHKTLHLCNFFHVSTKCKFELPPAFKKKMDRDMDEVGIIARAIKMKLEEIDLDNLENRKNPGCGKGTAVDRSRTAMTVSLKKKLRDKVNDFQMIDELIENGDSERIFKKAIQDIGRGQVIDTLEEIQERHDAVKEIEQKLLELHQIFMDMAVLVEAQGEMLDNIESQVANAVNHVQNGTEALQTAKSLQKKSRKCMCSAIILFLIIAIIMALSIIKPWKR
ncbi:hypothetical protein IEQ34_001152 [Dendrobium chrysotoxum]|uniref:t-SNARE coiled-coil homology domain-containing protein n=1 Tax=Dendrobium chrysotoxum TaxID=161865 RepID=A0AAV7HP88_DENCH|nr:hypothetical protein IEQ34_001152 [Dendrobium chrysotoxum]